MVLQKKIKTEKKKGRNVTPQKKTTEERVGGTSASDKTNCRGNDETYECRAIPKKGGKKKPVGKNGGWECVKNMVRFTDHGKKGPLVCILSEKNCQKAKPPERQGGGAAVWKEKHDWWGRMAQKKESQ